MPVLRDPTVKPEFGTPLDRSHPANRGMVARWVFNEGGGDRSLAQGTAEFPLSPFEDPAPLWRPHRRGVASEADGPNDAAWRADDHPALRFGGRDFTCLAWVTLLDVLDGHLVNSLISKGLGFTGSDGQHEYALWYNSGTEQFFLQFRSATGTLLANVTVGNPAFSGASNHVGHEFLLMFGHNAAANVIVSQVVGVNGLRQTTPSAPWTHNGTNALRIGHTSAGRLSHAIFDQVILYERLLEPDELLRLHAEPYGGFLPGAARRFASLPAGRPWVYHRLLQQNV